MSIQKYIHYIFTTPNGFVVLFFFDCKEDNIPLHQEESVCTDVFFEELQYAILVGVSTADSTGVEVPDNPIVGKISELICDRDSACTEDQRSACLG